MYESSKVERLSKLMEMLEEDVSLPIMFCPTCSRYLLPEALDKPVCPKCQSPLDVNKNQQEFVDILCKCMNEDNIVGIFADKNQ